MNFQEALEMALGKEKQAVAMYQKFSLEYPALKELFESLMNEEEKHVKAIQMKITELYK